MPGYCGKVLFVDLTNGSITQEPLHESVYRNFIGGAGLGVKILYERVKANVDALGPENMLGFVPGLLTGTQVPMASKCLVVTKSPLTHTWGDANTGGWFGHEIKAAGYDGIFFSGTSQKPVYLWVHEGEAQIRDATHLWGKDTIESEQSLYREIGDKRLRMARIGRAGELQSLISSIVTDQGRVAGRSGVGAVMGAKRLKAVVVKGTNKTEVANIDQFAKLRAETLQHLRDLDHLPFIKRLSLFGTCSGIPKNVPIGDTPIKNWSLIGEEAFPDYQKICQEHILKYQIKKTGCGNCPVNCGGIVAVREGPYASEGRKPEYESVAALGPLLLNSDAESIIKANDICDRYGIDTISTGAVMAFAMECYEKGIIGKRETGGVELTWGNTSAILAMLGQIVRREGFGDVLADGVAQAAKRIGRGSEEFAIHVHGQELAYHDPRLAPCRGLDELGNATPGRHMPSAVSTRMESEGVLGPYPGIEIPKDEDEYKRRGKIHAIGGSYSQIFSDSGMCLFANSTGSKFPLVEFIRSVTGWDFNIAEAITTGKRILTLRQAFNVRDGLRPKQFIMPDRLLTPFAAGPFTGVQYDFAKLRDRYFEAMGWDTETGRPSEQCLTELELQGLVKSLP